MKIRRALRNGAAAALCVSLGLLAFAMFAPPPECYTGHFWVGCGNTVLSVRAHALLLGLMSLMGSAAGLLLYRFGEFK